MDMLCAQSECGSSGSGSRLRRLGAASVCVGIGGVFAVAASLVPRTSGHGTHEALGLPPCSMYAFTGTPCPTCGYTTAFSHVAHGELLTAFVVQPAAALLALAVAAAWAIALVVLVTGRPVHRRFAGLVRTNTLWAVIAIVGAAWAYKIFYP